MQHIQGTVCSNTINGRLVHFFVKTPNDVIQAHHFAGQFYEPEELSIISQYFESGSVFADIGANVGNHSVYTGCFLNPSRIIIIEPNPAAIPYLKLNMQLNNLSAVVDDTKLGIGLSDQFGFAEPFTPYASNLGETIMQVGQENGTIPIFSGDIVFNGTHVDFLKIDVEAMEINVLMGLARLIARCRPKIFVEVDVNNFAAFEQWREDNGYAVATRFKRYQTNENYMLTPLSRDQ